MRLYLKTIHLLTKNKIIPLYKNANILKINNSSVYSIYTTSYFNFGDSKKVHSKNDKHAKNIKDEYINKTTMPVNKAAKAQAKHSIDGNHSNPSNQKVLNNDIRKKLNFIRTDDTLLNNNIELDIEKVLPNNINKQYNRKIKNKDKDVSIKNVKNKDKLKDNIKTSTSSDNSINAESNSKENKDIVSLNSFNLLENDSSEFTEEYPDDDNKEEIIAPKNNKIIIADKIRDIDSFEYKTQFSQSLNYPLIVTKPKYYKKTKAERKAEYEDSIEIKQDIEDYFKYSHYKLNKAIKKIRGLYLFEAEEVLKNDYSKGSKLIQFEIKKFKESKKNIFYKKSEMSNINNKNNNNNIKKNYNNNNNNNNDFDINNSNDISIIDNDNKDNDSQNKIKNFNHFNNNFLLKIKEAFVGGSKGHSIPCYRAKGRVDFRTRKNSSFKIKFEKVPIEKFCQELAEGKATKVVNHKIKEALYKIKASYETVKSLSYLTTQKGKQERKNTIKSLILEIKKKYYEQNKKVLSDFIIRQELVKDLGQKTIPIYNRLLLMDEYIKDKKDNDSKILIRQNNFNRNLKNLT